MGSEVVEALVVQKGNLQTNPDGLDPDTSRPIEQTPFPFTNNEATSQPIQQRSTLETARVSDSNQFSRPIEQLGDFVHADTIPNEELNHVIQQFRLVSAAHPNSQVSPKPESPIEQVRFTTPDLQSGGIQSTRPIQQVLLETSGSSTSRPLEQKPTIENSIQITQFDFVDLIFPACNSVKNPVDTNILWRIRDFGSPFDTTSIIFTVNGVQVQDRAEFVVTSLPSGLQIFYDPPENFDFDEEVIVTITISDTADPANTFFLRCIWETVPDARGPIFENISPACNSTNVDVLEPISFDVFDLGGGVDPDSIRLSIEGITVCSGVSLEPITEQVFTTLSGVPVGFTVDGFHVEYTHPEDPFRYDAAITLALEATDLSGNSSLEVCFFETEASRSPIFTNVYPEPCDTFIDNTTGLSFEVYGVEQGVDISTLEVRVDNKLRKVFVRPRLLRAE